jgi:drug/metabolite transporter (DMT)-like permease
MSQRLKIILAFAAIYVVWGSTYLAIRVGVQHLPATLLAGTRFAIAGVLMLLGLAVLRRRVLPVRRDWLTLIGSGLLLLVGGNGLVVLAEKTVPSGPAALVVATVPLWVALLEAVLPGGERLAARGWAGIALGFFGLVVLNWPELVAGARQALDPLGVLILVLASFSWACGTLLMRRRPASLDPLAVTGWQSLAGGLCHLLLAATLQRGEPVEWNAEALYSVAYLIGFGSLIGFTAYGYLIAHVPPAKVSTYAYVNPAIAVLLGWWILHEPLDVFVLGGMAVILLAVALVNSARVQARPPRVVAVVPADGERNSTTP